MFLQQPLRSATNQVLNILLRMHKAILVVLLAGLGLVLGSIFYLYDVIDIAISLLVVFIVMLTIIAKPLNGVLLWLLFAPFLEKAINIPMGGGLPDLSYSRFIIAFLAIFMLAKAAIGKLRFVRISVVDVCIVGTTLGLMISAPMSENPIAVIQKAIAIHFTPLVAYFFTRNLVRNKSDLEKIFWAIAILGFVSGLATLFESATGNVLFRDQSIIATKSLIRDDSGIRVIRGIYIGSGSMGRVLALTIPVTLYLFLERKNIDLVKFVVGGMLIIETYAIIVTMSRAPWIGLLASLFVMQFFYPQFRKIFYMIVIVAAVVLWATWDNVLDSDVVARVNDETSTLEGRQVRWDAGFKMWEAKPIRGWGFGRFQDEAGRFRTDGETKNFGNGSIENDFLHILVGGGLIAFAPYFLFLLIPLLMSLRLFAMARAPDWSGFIKKETITVYWAMILSLLITSYSTIHVQPYIKIMAFAVAGSVVGTHDYLLRRSKKANTEVPVEPL